MTQNNKERSAWIQDEKLAIQLLNVVSNLWLDKSVELLIFRRRLVDSNVSEILNDHLYARRFVQQPVDVATTLQLAETIAAQDMPPARIDLGKLAAEWIQEKGHYDTADAFVKDKLSHIVGNQEFELEPKDVVLYGFGRIGRLAARVLIQEAGKGEQLRLRAIVTRNNSDEDILKRANLLRKDSVHGKLAGIIEEDLENKALIINGQRVYMLAANSPTELDYTQYDIDNALVIDNTGAWRDEEGLSQHLKSKGVDKVLLTAPGKGKLPNIVHGVNHLSYTPEDAQIYTAASCTTNAIVPVLKVINDELGIDSGHIETVHAYTNDQNLLDNYHKKYRRGKAAPLNMVITETGAAKAVAKALPELGGKLTGNAVRVPVPNVSLAILNLNLKKGTSVEEINKLLRQASLSGELVEQIDFSLSNEFVSTDVVGNSHASVVDAPATIVSDTGDSAVLYVWYDNEYGYTRQVVRLAKYLSRVIRLRYY